MITLYHAPNSRSTRILALLAEMGVEDRVRIQMTDIPRLDGTGARDPLNPHPEGKVPCLTQGAALMTESGAIILALLEAFPAEAARVAPAPQDPARGAFLTWLFWAHAVQEPVMIMAGAGLSHPWITSSLRGPEEVSARLSAALARGPWLCGEQFTAADLLVSSPYLWFRDFAPQDPAVQDWIDRCAARPGYAKVAAIEAAAMAAG